MGAPPLLSTAWAASPRRGWRFPVTRGAGFTSTGFSQGAGGARLRIPIADAPSDIRKSPVARSSPPVFLGRPNFGVLPRRRLSAAKSRRSRRGAYRRSSPNRYRTVFPISDPNTRRRSAFLEVRIDRAVGRSGKTLLRPPSIQGPSPTPTASRADRAAAPAAAEAPRIVGMGTYTLLI